MYILDFRILFVQKVTGETMKVKWSKFKIIERYQWIDGCRGWKKRRSFYFCTRKISRHILLQWYRSYSLLSKQCHPAHVNWYWRHFLNAGPVCWKNSTLMLVTRRRLWRANG